MHIRWNTGYNHAVIYMFHTQQRCPCMRFIIIDMGLILVLKTAKYKICCAHCWIIWKAMLQKDKAYYERHFGPCSGTQKHRKWHNSDEAVSGFTLQGAPRSHLPIGLYHHLGWRWNVGRKKSHLCCWSCYCPFASFSRAKISSVQVASLYILASAEAQENGKVLPVGPALPIHPTPIATLRPETSSENY